MSFISAVRDKLSALKPGKDDQSALTGRLASTVFTSCHDAVIRGYSLNPPALSSTLVGNNRAVYALHISPYAPHLLLSGGYDLILRVWDLRTGTLSAELHGHTDSIFCLLMLPDGRVASGSSDKTIKLWSLKTKKCEGTMTTHIGGILSLVYISSPSSSSSSSSAGGYIASCGIDHTIKFFSVQTQKCIGTIQGHSLPVASIALIDESSLLSAGHDGEIKKWRFYLPSSSSMTAATRKPELEFAVKAHEKSIHVICVIPESRLASAGRDASIKIWSLATLHTAVPLMVLNGHTKDINGLAWSLGERKLVSGSTDCTVRVWNIDREPINGSYCDATFTSQSVDGKPTVVYAVHTFRTEESLMAGAGATIKRSTSRNAMLPPSTPQQQPLHASSAAVSAEKPPVAPGAATAASIASMASLTDSQGNLKSKGRRTKIDAASAAALEQKRLEKLKRARELEKLRLLDQNRLLEEESSMAGLSQSLPSMDEEDSKRFTALLALPNDAELNPQTLATIKKYRNAHHLNYHDIITNGWFDDGGLIPGVNAAKVGKERGGVGRWEYDVIFFDSTKDAHLHDVIETAKRLVRQQDTVKGRVQILAQFVSNKLGGLPNDIITAWQRVLAKAQRYRAVKQSQLNEAEQASVDSRTILPIGALIGEVGLTRHRAALFKYLCDLTVQNPEEWCYPVDHDGPVSPHAGSLPASPMPVYPTNGNSNSGDEKQSALNPLVDDSAVSMPLNRFLTEINDPGHLNNTNNAISPSNENENEEDADRPRLRLTRRSSDSDMSDKGDAPLLRLGRNQQSPDELAIHCRLIRGQYQYYVPRSRKNRDSTSNTPSSSPHHASTASPMEPQASPEVDERGRERIGGYHAWNVVIINGEHYVIDLCYEPSMLYHESSREAMHYNRGRRGTPKQTGLTNLPIRDVREIDYSEFTHITIMKDGGFGRVERARWGKLDVVIKTPLTSDTYVIKTFIEEARVLNTLNHPNVVQLIGVCSAKKAIILEYINGGDVHQWIRQHRPASSASHPNPLPVLTLKQRLDVLIQSALAMQYLHGCEPPIVHRDLKTLNLLINNVGSYRVIKVCDFGLARNQKSNDGISTQHKDMGTPCFQSPEQWRDDDEERLTEKTDCYSFGGILLEVLTDRIPWFEEKSKYAIYQHVVVEKRGPPIPPVQAYTIPPMLIDLIRWCQAHEPDKRPSFPEILRVLREVDDSLPPD